MNLYPTVPFIRISLKYFYMRKIIFSCFCCLFLTFCNNSDKELKEALSLAGSNRAELEKVINHFRNTGNKKKVKAACYLISNMKEKYSTEDKALNIYFKVYKDISGLYKSGITDKELLDSIVKFKFDSLEQYFGPIIEANLEKKYDLTNLKSDYLIKNIDLAFEVWNKPWAKHINFQQFCEYILPYRIHDEPIQEWRSFLFNKFKFLTDSLKNPADPKELAYKVEKYISLNWKHLDNFIMCNYYPGINDIENYRVGICEHLYFLNAAVLRSLGVAVAIDNTPQWRNWPGKHSWLVLIDTSGKTIAFNPGTENLEFFYKPPMGATSKIYRYSYTVQKSSIIYAMNNNDLIPKYFYNKFLYDVSGSYDFPYIDFEINMNAYKNAKFVYLSAFDYSISTQPIAWARVVNDKGAFKNIGYPAIYLATFYTDRNEQYVDNPIFIGENKEISILTPDTTHNYTVILKRKFPMSDSMKLFSYEMIGSGFQASNSPDFRDAVDMLIIKDTIDSYGEMDISINKNFRYIRYCQINKSRINIAEIEFYTKNSKNNEIKLKGKVIGNGKVIKGSRDNAFDNNIRTNLTSSPGSWVGLDLGKPFKITKIRFLTRNDFNIIEVGDIYELIYFDFGWHSLGKKQADKNYLIYENVPRNALLVLRNLSQGKEERIFIYDDKRNRQLWW